MDTSEQEKAEGTGHEPRVSIYVNSPDNVVFSADRVEVNIHIGGSRRSEVCIHGVPADQETGK